MYFLELVKIEETKVGFHRCPSIIAPSIELNKAGMDVEYTQLSP